MAATAEQDARQLAASVGQKRGAEAAEHFRRALALDAEHTAALFGLADAYRRLGRSEDALAGFRRLLALAPHDSKAVLAMAETIRDLTGSRSEIVQQDLPVDDPKIRQPDITLAVERLGWGPTVPLDEGLPKTIEYFRSIA